MKFAVTSICIIWCLYLGSICPTLVNRDIEGWIMIVQRSISVANSQDILKLDTAIQCRDRCFAMSTCNTASIIINSTEEEVECRITSKVVHNILLESTSDDQEQVTFARKDSFSFEHFLGEDDMFYMIKRDSFSHEEAENYCKDQPGGQLLTLSKMESVRSFHNYWNILGYGNATNGQHHHAVSLKKVNENGQELLVWGDGITYDRNNAEYTSMMLLDTTGDESRFTLFSHVSEFMLKLEARNSYAICQLKTF